MGRPALDARRTFTADPRRRVQAEHWLSTQLTAWELQPALAGRWLAAADQHLHDPDDLQVVIEFDPDMGLFSLEVWRESQRLYGIDDWLG